MREEARGGADLAASAVAEHRQQVAAADEAVAVHVIHPEDESDAVLRGRALGEIGEEQAEVLEVDILEHLDDALRQGVDAELGNLLRGPNPAGKGEAAGEVD